jgi:hypothetical protein
MKEMAKIAKAFIGHEVFAGRRKNNIIKNPVYIHEDYYGYYQQDYCRAHDMPPQNFKMIEKAHLTGGRFCSPDPLKKYFSLRTGIRQLLSFVF